MWDYDKLFANNNVIGVKVLSSNNIYNYVVDSRKSSNIIWSYYKNNKLKDKDDGNSEIQYIIHLDEHGNVVEKLFDRERDMAKPMPELETGMFVRVSGSGLGFVDAENNHIIYQNNGYDYINDNIFGKGVACKIIEVYSKNTLAYDFCTKRNLIWYKIKIN